MHGECAYLRHNGCDLIGIEARLIHLLILVRVIDQTGHIFTQIGHIVALLKLLGGALHGLRVDVLDLGFAEDHIGAGDISLAVV
jgi:hypothetical protein